MPEILLIDDDENLTELLGEYLAGQGFAARAAGDGREGLRALFERKPDLIALDVTMPNKDGWETLARIREVSDAPVIMLTARGEEADVLRGFSLGADDYVTKPFSFAQLAARIKAVLARGGRGESNEGRLVGGDLEVDLSARRVTRGGEPLTLTPTELKLLVTLMRRAGEVVSPDELVRDVWGPQYADEIGHVRRYVWHLRRKIEPDPEHPRYIHNERGYGYRFQATL
jgi:two-component system KDP operon response regulator KdpE